MERNLLYERHIHLTDSLRKIPAVGRMRNRGSRSYKKGIFAGNSTRHQITSLCVSLPASLFQESITMNITNHQLLVETASKDGHTKFYLCKDRESKAVFLEAQNGGPFPELLWLEGTTIIPGADRICALIKGILSSSWIPQKMYAEAKAILAMLGDA